MVARAQNSPYMIAAELRRRTAGSGMSRPLPIGFVAARDDRSREIFTGKPFQPALAWGAACHVIVQGSFFGVGQLIVQQALEHGVVRALFGHGSSPSRLRTSAFSSFCTLLLAL